MTFENKALAIACICAAMTFCSLSPQENTAHKKTSGKTVVQENSIHKNKDFDPKAIPSKSLKDTNNPDAKKTSSEKKDKKMLLAIFLNQLMQKNDITFMKKNVS